MNCFYNKLKEKALLGQEIIKEYDLLKEVDTGLSDHYIIDNEKGYLQFGYSIQKEVEFNDLKLYRFGSFTRQGSAILLVPNIDIHINDSVRRSQVFFDKPVYAEETPIIHLSFDMNDETDVCIWLGNDYAFETYDSYIKGTIPWESERKNSSRFKRTAIFFNSSGVYVEQFCGKERTNRCMDISIINQSNKIDCYIDIEKGYFRLGQNGKRIYHSGLRQQEYSSINISCNSNGSQHFFENIPGLVINRFELCKEEGAVYFKPLDILSAEELRITVLHKGNVAIQYFNQEHKEWLPINGDIKVKELSQVSLRALMHTNDRLYDLLVLKP